VRCLANVSGGNQALCIELRIGRVLLLRDSVVCSLRHYLEEAGLPADVRFHDLRHTAGTLALRQGVPSAAISASYIRRGTRFG
jgi:hypothetical protein